MALIQKMGMDRLLRAELQSKPAKPKSKQSGTPTPAGGGSILASPGKDLEDDEAQVIVKKKESSNSGLNLIARKIAEYDVEKPDQPKTLASVFGNTLKQMFNPGGDTPAVETIEDN